MQTNKVRGTKPSVGGVLVNFIFNFEGVLLIAMQTEEHSDLKEALMKCGYSGTLADKIIAHYLHSDLKLLT